MKNAIIDMVGFIVENLNNGTSECLVDIFDEVEREIETEFENVSVREPYSKDNGRFIEIEIEEDEYLYVCYRWDRENSIHNPELLIWVTD